MNGLIQDVKYALRQMRKAPGFTLTAVLTLALGNGANAAIFTLVHAALLQNLPMSDPKALVRLGDKDDCCVMWGRMALGAGRGSVVSMVLREAIPKAGVGLAIDPVKALRTE